MKVYTRRFTVLLFVLSLFTNILLLIAGHQNQQAEADKPDLIPSEDKNSEANVICNERDDKVFLKSYKLFYGSWTATEIVESDFMLPEAVEDAESKVGNTFYFDEDIVKWNDELISESPQYSISIIPLSEWKHFSSRRFPLEYFDFNRINTEGFFKCPFFCYAELYSSIKGMYIGFYIWDDDTLILDGGALLKLERSSHIPGYEEYIERP